MSPRAFKIVAGLAAAASLASAGVAVAVAAAPGAPVTVTVEEGTPYGVTQAEVEALLRQTPAPASRPFRVIVGPGPLTAAEDSASADLGADVVIRLRPPSSPLPEATPGRRPVPLAVVEVAVKRTLDPLDGRLAGSKIRDATRTGLSLGQRSAAVAAGVRESVGQFAPGGSGVGTWVGSCVGFALLALGALGLGVRGRASWRGLVGLRSRSRERLSALKSLVSASGEPRSLEAHRLLDDPPAGLSGEAARALLLDARALGEAARTAPRSSTDPALPSAAELSAEFLRRTRVLEAIGLLPARHANGIPAPAPAPGREASAEAVEAMGPQRLLGASLEVLCVRLLDAPRGVFGSDPTLELLPTGKSDFRRRQKGYVRSRQELQRAAQGLTDAHSDLMRAAAAGGAALDLPAPPAFSGRGAVPSGHRELLAATAVVDLAARRVLGLPEAPGVPEAAQAPDDDPDEALLEVYERRRTAPRSPRMAAARAATLQWGGCALVVAFGVGAGAMWGSATGDVPPRNDGPGRVQKVSTLDGSALPPELEDLPGSSPYDYEQIKLPADADVLAVTVPLSRDGEAALARARTDEINKSQAEITTALPLADMLEPFETARREAPELFTPAGDPLPGTIVLGYVRSSEDSSAFVGLATAFSYHPRGIRVSAPTLGEPVEFLRDDYLTSGTGDGLRALRSVDRLTGDAAYAPEPQKHPWRGAFIGGAAGLAVYAWWPWRRRG